MNVTLKLDTAAMQALFPEGTEARVQLQRCVISNVAERVLEKDATYEIERLLQQPLAVQREVLNEMVRQHVGQYFSSRHDLAPTAKARIREQVRETLNEEIKAELAVLKTQMQQEVRNHVDRIIADLQNLATLEAVKAIRADIKAKLLEAAGG